MKRAGTIALVLMGGGLVVWDLMPSVFFSGDTPECAEAGRADAQARQPGSPEPQLLADCQAGASGHGGSGHSWFHGGSSGSRISAGTATAAGAAAGVAAASVARGGFGASGIAHASGGG